MQTLFEILADGLDASTDGRGWGAEHERARVLANEAPAMLEALRKAHWLLCELEAPAHLDEGAEIDTLITGILARIDGNSLSAQETCEVCGFRISDAPAEDTCDCKRENY